MILKPETLKQAPSETTREGVGPAQAWAIGLIDGDGHIALEATNKAKTKFVPLLKVSLHKNNARAIYKLKQALGVGKVSKHKSMLTLRVRRIGCWKNVLKPLFLRFPLRTCKYHDASLVLQYLDLDRSQPEFKSKTQALSYALTRNGKTHVHDPSPVWGFHTPCESENRKRVGQMSQHMLQQILHPDWMAGFVEAEGSFYMLKTLGHGFALGQARDGHIIQGFCKFFNIKAALKLRPNYVMVDTKNTAVCLKIGTYLRKRMFGIKSLVCSVWLRSLTSRKRSKKVAAKKLLLGLAQRHDHIRES